MTKININFDVKSLKQAIKKVKTIRGKIQSETPSIFIDKCLNWVMNRANMYLSSLNMGGNVIADIQGGWHIETVAPNIKRLVNTSQKAVFVEFGVGKKAQTEPHPNANNNTPPYEYNVNSGKKDYQGRWRFRVSEETDVDLIVGNYDRDGDLILTSGSPATLYLYNASMDLISEGAYKKLWQETLKQTI